MQFVFAGGRSAYVQTAPRGFAGLPAVYWLLCAMALAVYLVGIVVLMAKPNGRNLLYALITLCQAGNLVFIAIESSADLAMPDPVAHLDLPLRIGFDLFTAAAIVHAASVHPRRLPGAPAIAVSAWLLAAALTVGVSAGPGALRLVVGAGRGGGLRPDHGGADDRSHQLEPHPFATVLRRFGIVTLVTWVLLTARWRRPSRTPACSTTSRRSARRCGTYSSPSLIVLVPFLSRSQQVMRASSRCWPR